jgi:gentisate 1,2-dioxygenase
MWHEHGSDAAEPVVWLDGLDIPMLRFFDAGFAENDTRDTQTVTQPEGTSFARYGQNMAPVREAGGMLFSYPYERSRAALDRLEQAGAIDE